MKYFTVIILLLLSITFVSYVKAESPTNNSDSTKKGGVTISAGFFLVPQAEMELTKFASEEDGGLYKFKSSTPPLFGAGLIKINKITLAPFYLFNNNSIGLLVEHQTFERLGCFSIISKSTMENSGKVGFALTTPLADKKATAFIELCMPWNGREWKKTLSVGIIIPFVATLKE